MNTLSTNSKEVAQALQDLTNTWNPGMTMDQGFDFLDVCEKAMPALVSATLTAAPAAAETGEGVGRIDDNSSLRGPAQQYADNIKATTDYKGADIHLRFAVYHGYTLAALSLPQAPVVAAEGEQWVIISMKQGRGLPYWRPNSGGYTDSVTDAGKYGREEAQAIIAGNHGDDTAYCVSDMALDKLIADQSMVRSKELRLWNQLAALSTRPALPAPTEGEYRLTPTVDCRCAGVCTGHTLTIDTALPPATLDYIRQLEAKVAGTADLHRQAVAVFESMPDEARDLYIPRSMELKMRGDIDPSNGIMAAWRRMLAAEQEVGELRDSLSATLPTEPVATAQPVEAEGLSPEHLAKAQENIEQCYCPPGWHPQILLNEVLRLRNQNVRLSTELGEAALEARDKSHWSINTSKQRQNMLHTEATPKSRGVLNRPSLTLHVG